MSKPVEAGDWLDAGRLMRLLGVIVLVLAPQTPYLPPWISLAVAGFIVWRGVATLRGWSLPGGTLRVLLTLAAFAAVLVTYGRSTGQEAGTAMLCLMIGLKLTELRGRRDIMVVLLLLYFTILTQFLRDQPIWTVPWMLVSVLAITALLVDCNRLQSAPLRLDLRESGRVLLLALPVMAVLWVLFPRIPGPLWGSPAESASAQTGISESMAPGDIAELIRSDAVAFRVRFDGAPPPPNQRYWRGPVLWHTDGRRWEIWRGDRRIEAPELRLRGDGIDYELTLEPQRLRYVFALEMVPPDQLRDGLAHNPDGTVVSRDSLGSRKAFTLRSYPQFQLNGDSLDDAQRHVALRLPGDANPRTRELAEGWQREARNTAAVVDRALRYFRNEEFRYTLNPPPLGSHSVDAFLFDTRAGFCEHYAGAFVTLMRAAGIPARVVLGYQGGEQSLVGNYLIVRQSDAHAWAEVWTDERGWRRVDPTAAVAPDRVEQNLLMAMDARGEQLPRRWSRRVAAAEWLSARWDYANMQWNRWFLAYGPELQRAILSRIGLGDWQRMLLALTALIAVLMIVIALISLRAVLHRRPDDAAAVEWQRVTGRMQRSGLGPLPTEGPRDYGERVRRALAGSDRAAFNDAVDTYLRLRYLDPRDEDRDALLLRLRDARRRLPAVSTRTMILLWRKLRPDTAGRT